MLEAVGVLKDARASAVVIAIFESGNVRNGVRLAAARAAGRLGGDAELKALTSHAKSGDPLELAAIHGLGEMMRLESAKHVAKVLATTKDVAVAEAAATALGSLGSSWAWKSLGPKAAATGLQVRTVCADALVPRYARAKGNLRTLAGESVILVEHPQTLDLLQSERAAAGADVKAVDALIAKVERQRKRAPR
ncbi:MAG: hypothetical protein IPI67_07820 [Myxococcales bacterium]|nr:hypothetical protein [Myxococcales bacterium]